MTGFGQVHTPRWVSYFAAAGYPGAVPLAAGVEGAVYRLADDVVAKVWARRRLPDLLPAQRFYADVAAAGLPFATPVVLRAEQVGDTAVTYERHLPGVPLQTLLNDDRPDLDATVVDCLVRILRALATVPATPAMRQLAVLDESEPLWTGAADFPAALTALLRRRSARHGDLLARHVPGFADRHRRLLRAVDALDRVPPTVLHGDLFGANILIDDAGRPSAVLDFGFLSTAGDPRLDAAVTALITDMYGPHAATRAATLTHLFAAELGHPPEVLLTYQAAYAAATANAFTDDGSDGHFAWCVTQLNRPDIVDLLGG